MADRFMRGWDARRAIRRMEVLGQGLHRMGSLLARLRGAAELRAMDERELHDLGLDRAGIEFAVRHGRPATSERGAGRQPGLRPWA